MIEKKFVKDGIKKAKLEEFLDEDLRRANYSHIDITQTPTSTHITIFAEKPALVIGRGGSHINEIIDRFENEFGIENPQVDVQEVETPDMDAAVVAKNIASWLEKGGHPKRVGNTYARRVMDAGAVGVEIEISGKLSGSRGRTEKFTQGYVKKCGDTANDFVEKAYEVAVTKPGTLGVKVKIMKDMPEYMRKAFEKRERELEVEMEVEAEEEEGAEEEDAEEMEEEIDYEDLVKENISDIKERVEEENLDLEKVLEAEKENKERVTLIEWLERRID